VPELLRLALREPDNWLNSFDLPHSKEAILAYLENLLAKLVDKA
jgi:hypothetical protein